MKRQKRRIETQNPWGYYTSTNTKHEEATSTQEEAKITNDIVECIPEETNTDSKEETMATMLWESAMQINSILEGNLGDDLDYKLADSKNSEALEIDFTRRKGDKLIDCLGKISATLNQLSDLVQKCN